MSAPSLMCGTRILILALAVMMAVAAHAAPDAPANPHRKAASSRLAHSAPAAAPSHTRHHSAQSRAARKTNHTAARRTSHSAAKSHPPKASSSGALTTQQRRPMQEDAKRAKDRRKRHSAPPTHRTDPEPQPPVPAPTEAAMTADEPAARLAEDAPPPPASLRQFTEQASLRIARGGTPPPLRGSAAVLERQNERLEADGLERIDNEDDLAARIEHHLLVPLPASNALTVNQALPANHRYCRPWTAQFLKDLARAHDAAFHRPLEVSSAVRPASYQERLKRTNGNAAAAEGDIVSPHILGATIDIAKSGLTAREIGWMRTRLLALEDAGKIDVEEEFQQACFHISVYKSYAPPRTAQVPQPHTARGQTRDPQPDADFPTGGQ